MAASAYSDLSEFSRANHLHAPTLQVYNRIKRNHRWPSDFGKLPIISDGPMTLNPTLNFEVP